VPLELALVEDPIEVMFNGAAAAMRSLTESVRRDARDFAVSLTEYVHRDFSLVDITAPGATKGRALAWRAEQLGLGRDEVMAVGDNFNDLEMLEFAGTPVVMANAVDGLKRQEWHVTGHQDECGLAEAIRRFALDGRDETAAT
jgi:hydroxymethylpyrimidine pyrophosphatase-like HAD family hydrolase